LFNLWSSVQFYKRWQHWFQYFKNPKNPQEKSENSELIRGNINVEKNSTIKWGNLEKETPTKPNTEIMD
jgi:hypothetical protein